jgi:hypothetical protein
VSKLSMRQKIVAKYQEQCRDKDILPASAYEIQLLIDCAFEALSEPTPAMRTAAYQTAEKYNHGQSTDHVGAVAFDSQSIYRAMIRAAQEGK